MSIEARTLFVYLNDTPMGRLLREKGGRLRFQYTDEYLSNPGALPLSLSIPLEDRKYSHKTISPWLWGLLPDNELILARWAQRFQVSASNCFGLLEGMGEDCAGAVHFVRPDKEGRAHKGGREPLDASDIERRLGELRKDPSLGREPEDRGQFSLAGAQSKTALQKRGDKWYVPWGREPTTHILKPPRPDIDGHVENEHFCLCLAKELGLAAARSEILHFGSEIVIVVERYDRVMHERRLIRVHQEDICQALSIHPAMKYQSEGGPDVIKMMELMNRFSQPVADRRRIMDAIAFNYLILGTDAHAKNYSLLIGRNQQLRLAPLYDVASYLPYVDRYKDCRFAMKIGGYYKDNQIRPRHFDKMARACEFPAPTMRKIIVDMADQLPDTADWVKKEMADQGVTHKVLDDLVELLKKRSNEKSQEFSV